MICAEIELQNSCLVVSEISHTLKSTKNTLCALAAHLRVDCDRNCLGLDLAFYSSQEISLYHSTAL